MPLCGLCKRHPLDPLYPYYLRIETLFPPGKVIYRILCLYCHASYFWRPMSDFIPEHSGQGETVSLMGRAGVPPADAVIVEWD